MIDEANPYRPQVALLFDVLPRVAAEDCFAIKGGTAINLFVRNLPRLSVDIDLTYLPVHDRQTSLAAIGAALERIASNLEAELRGVTVQRQVAEGQVIKLIARRNGVPVKVEANAVLRGSVREPALRGASPAVEEQFGYIEVPVLHPHDLYAGKLVAALDRQHPRDLFDVLHLLREDGLDDDLFEVFLVYAISGDKTIAALFAPRLHPLATVFEEQFRGMALSPVTLDELEEARTRMIDAIRARLTARHKEFLLGFKQGEPNWALLQLEGVADLPAVQWKLRNISEMSSGQHQEAIDLLRRVLYG